MCHTCSTPEVEHPCHIGTIIGFVTTALFIYTLYMFSKLLLKLTLLSALSLIIPPYTIASVDFHIDSRTEYRIQEDGKTKVTNHITIENTKPGIYASTYNLNLENIEVVSPRVIENNVILPANVSKSGNTTTLTVNFSKPVVGSGNKRNVVIEYQVDTFAEKRGEVWEISIPGLSRPDSFRKYEVTLIVPTSFGKKAYMSPVPIQIEETNQELVYTYDKNSFENTGITAGFGKFQVFSFVLNYHLENPLQNKTKTQIALPPDTAFQQVHYDSILPSPDKVEMDEDGNWLAFYTLSPREKLDITAAGFVQIFNQPRLFRPMSAKSTLTNLRPTFYWQSTDTKIKELARTYSTPKEIYDFVVNYLSYDYEKVKSTPVRLGAINAIANPTNAVCTEFTDLFIAIARAAGIPAREINGFAYTENPQIQPLSLVADVLHSWPEYYSVSSNAWIPIDPTWGSTTNGVDFFENFDLRHFAFVIHGKDDRLPYPAGSYKLGATPQKDVFVNFAELPAERDTKIQIKHRLEGIFSPFSRKLHISIENQGPRAVYNLTPEISFPEDLNLKELPYLLPYSKEEFSITIKYSFLGTKTPDNILIKAGNSEENIDTQKDKMVIYHLLILCLILVSILVSVYLRGILSKKLHFLPGFAKIAKTPKNAKNKSKKTPPKKK
jgi:hypothetical protein